MHASFQQMAAQRQSVFCSSGDQGALATGKHLSVCFPASDPVVCAVGEGAFGPQAFTKPVQPPPPPAPSGLKTVPGAGKVTVTWNASPGATSYNVKRSAKGTGVFPTIKSGLTLLTYTDAGLASGMYFYQISAVGPGDEGANGAAVSVTAAP